MSKLTDIRSASEKAFAAWVTALTAGATEFTPANGTFTIYPGYRVGELEPPYLCVSCENAVEVEARGFGLHRCDLILALCTSVDEARPSDAAADDWSAATIVHQARWDLLINRLQDVEQVATAITQGGTLQVFGIELANQQPAPADNLLIDLITLTVHCRTL